MIRQLLSWSTELEQQFQVKVRELQRHMHEELALQQAACEANITSAAKVLSSRLVQQDEAQQQARYVAAARRSAVGLCPVW
jgi:hypothetical protein